MQPFISKIINGKVIGLTNMCQKCNLLKCSCDRGYWSGFPIGEKAYPKKKQNEKNR